VGVGAYPDKDLALDFAAKDAKDFAALMLRQKGGLYGEATARILTDAGATREAVLDGLAWLRRAATDRDTAVVFLSGHGITEPNGTYYYLPVNGQPEKLAGTAVVFSEIRNTLMSLPGKAVLFVDTCHAGDVLGGRNAASDVSSMVNELSSAENGVVVFASSTGGQSSLEDASWGNGAFTKALVEGVTGKADYTGRGRITVTSLDLWLSDRVAELTEGRQTPTTAKPRTIPDFPLALKR
ncbi:MAG TPA: caspase family protein, partial [Geomonas sp.]